MADKPSGLVQGTLDMLILKTLELEPIVSGIPQAGTGRLAQERMAGHCEQSAR